MRLGLGSLAFLIWSAGAALATPGQDLVTASLRQQGFDVQLVHWTFLGRIRIIAVSDDIRREIVINPNTGEILRDYSAIIVVALPDAGDDQRQNDNSDPATARSETDLDQSALSALEELSVGMSMPLVAESGQE